MLTFALPAVAPYPHPLSSYLDRMYSSYGESSGAGAGAGAGLAAAGAAAPGTDTLEHDTRHTTEAPRRTRGAKDMPTKRKDDKGKQQARDGEKGVGADHTGTGIGSSGRDRKERDP